jgi:hypothetical protein
LKILIWKGKGHETSSLATINGKNTLPQLGPLAEIKNVSRFQVFMTVKMYLTNSVCIPWLLTLATCIKLFTS